MSGCPARAGPILFLHRPVIRNGCVRKTDEIGKKYVIVETVATSQAINFGLAKNKASYGKFCLFMIVKISNSIKICEMH